MSYLASIYACLLALFGAFVLWALPPITMALAEGVRSWVKARRLSSSNAPAPSARTSPLAGRISSAPLR